MMKVKLVYGPAKSGKTRHIIKCFIDNIEKNPVLIVPSAETLRWVKRTILFETDLAGFCGRRVLTFDNLVNILAQDIEHLTYIGKICLLRNIVNELQLKYFQPVKDYNGFYEALGAFISELKQGQILPEDFIKGLKKKGLTDKDKELSTIYSVYQERLNKLGLYDHEGKFWLVQKLLESGNSGPWADCRLLLVDGFQNFSPTELKILEAFGKITGEVIITLTFEKDSSQEEFFMPTAKTYNRLKETFGAFEELALSGSTQDIENVQTIACPGQTREVEEIAKEIKSLIIRRNKKPGDIAVLFRDLSPYKELIAGEFRRYGIPCSISEGYPLKRSPVVRCIMGLFDIILGNWSRESVLNFLKSNYVIFESQMDVDRFGEVSRKAGIIEGKNSWINRLKSGPEKDYIARFISALERLEKESNPSVLKDLISFFGIETRIACCKDPYLLKQEVSAYTRFMEGLEELKNIENTGLKSFYEYLGMMIDTIEYQSEKRNTCAVQVMDVHRARGLSFPLVFIGGLLERIFPRQIQEEPFYSDRERLELRGFGINIEEAKEKQNEELFLFYMATHTARDSLYLTYPATDNEGKEQLPSHYMEKIGAKAETKVVHIADIIPQFDFIYTSDYLNPRIMLGLCKETAPGCGIAMYNYLIKKQDLLFRQTLSNLFLEEKARGILTDKKILEELVHNFGKDYVFSVSQFNEYGACPFVYFCKRLLFLEPLEPPEEEITPIDEGNLYHSILWEFYTALYKERDGNTIITPDEVDEMVSMISGLAEKHFKQAESEGLVNNMALWRLKKEEIIKNLKDFVLYEAQNSNPYKRPAYFEISFGMKKYPFADKASVTKPLVIDTVKIRGKIDRVDIIEPNMFSVLDYKSGNTQIRLSEIINGTNIQLPVYILAIKNLILKDMEPLEGYFWHLKTRKYFRANPLMRHKGSKPNPDWDTYIDSAIEYIKEYSKNIRQGRFPLVPEDKCKAYCDYKDICRK